MRKGAFHVWFSKYDTQERYGKDKSIQGAIKALICEGIAKNT